MKKDILIGLMILNRNGFIKVIMAENKEIKHNTLLATMCYQLWRVISNSDIQY